MRAKKSDKGFFPRGTIFKKAYLEKMDCLECRSRSQQKLLELQLGLFS